MADLSQDERIAIAQHPLPVELRTICDALREAERHVSTSSAEIDEDDLAPERPRLFVAAVQRLLDTLLTSPAAFALASRTGKDDLAADVLVLRRRVQKGDCDYQDYRPLSQLVMKQATDIEIWSAVITLIQTATHTTPPPSIPPSFDGTPLTHSSASQQGPEQTRSIVEARLFEEIRGCTYRGITGFHDKYFTGKSWSRRAEAAWLAAKETHRDGRWQGFPHPASEHDVCRWWFALEETILTTARGKYYTSTTSEMAGDRTKRQLDLFVKLGHATPTPKHDWREVLVIGELKASKSAWKATLLQIARYVRDVFAHQPTRRFVHAFTLRGTEMETWVFDRSGPYSATTFDIHDEPQRFIQVMCGYVMMSDEELGLDTFIQRVRGRSVVTITADDARSKTRTLELEMAPIACQRAIVCRGTTCYLAKVRQRDALDVVIKFSWTSDRRPPEAALLATAHARGVHGLARLIGYHQVTSISELRQGLAFTKAHAFRRRFGTNTTSSQHPRSQSVSTSRGSSIVNKSGKKRPSLEAGRRSSKRPGSSSRRAESIAPDEVNFAVAAVQGTSLSARNEQPYDNRILRVLAIAPAGKALCQFTSIGELVAALRDAIRVHQSLYLDGKILHRDVSENNIVITDPASAGGYHGMLIDLDLAKEEGTGSSGARQRTGTMEFMAIEVLLGIDHTYRHDLEAFLYVLVWLCARHGWDFTGNPQGRPDGTLLRRWYTGTYMEIAMDKRGAMNKGGFEHILREFPPPFDVVKPLCRQLRGILFPILDGDPFTGTPLHAAGLYGPTLSAYDDALALIRSEEGH